jgi:hypothetical protein
MELPQLWHLKPASRHVIVLPFTSGPMESLEMALIYKTGLCCNDKLICYVDLG